MNLSRYVTSRAVSERLKGLGLLQESLFWWLRDAIQGPVLIYESDMNEAGLHVVNCSAYTSGELGEMLPKGVQHRSYAEGWDSYFPGIRSHVAKTEADARAKMLIHLIENGYMKVEEANERMRRAG